MNLPSFSSPGRAGLRIILLGAICWTALGAAVGEEGPVLAADILERAATRYRGEPARILLALAVNLRAGTVTVGEARDLVDLMRCFDQLPPMATPVTGVAAPVPVPTEVRSTGPVPASVPAPAPLGAGDLERLLDAPAPRPAPPPAAAPAAEPAANPATDPVADPAAAIPDVIGAVKVVSAVGEGDLRIVIDKGTKDGVARLDRFRIERDGNTLVQAVVFYVKDDRCGAMILDQTWIPSVTEKTLREGDIAVRIAAAPAAKGE
jgi:hypothetical protein